jgi:hypothetical protein
VELRTNRWNSALSRNGEKFGSILSHAGEA